MAKKPKLGTLKGSVTETVPQMVKLAEGLELTADETGAVVRELKEAEAVSVSQEGLEAQIDYIVGEVGPVEAKHRLEEAVRYKTAPRLPEVQVASVHARMALVTVGFVPVAQQWVGDEFEEEFEKDGEKIKLRMRLKD